MLTRNFYRELGILYFSITCSKGQAFEFVSPLQEFTLDTPTVPVVVAGKFRGYNALRDPIEWPALPTKTEGGIAFPGKHKLEALEDGSIYACVCELPANLTEVTPDMFTLDHHYKEEGSSTTFRHSEGYRAVIVMSGRVMDTQTSLAYRPGEKIVVPEGGEVSLTPFTGSHIVGYREKAA